MNVFGILETTQPFPENMKVNPNKIPQRKSFWNLNRGNLMSKIC
jgi:hypothetical protein